MQKKTKNSQKKEKEKKKTHIHTVHFDTKNVSKGKWITQVDLNQTKPNGKNNVKEYEFRARTEWTREKEREKKHTVHV